VESVPIELFGEQRDHGSEADPFHVSRGGLLHQFNLMLSSCLELSHSFLLLRNLLLQPLDFAPKLLVVQVQSVEFVGGLIYDELVNVGLVDEVGLLPPPREGSLGSINVQLSEDLPSQLRRSDHFGLLLLDKTQGMVAKLAFFLQPHHQVVKRIFLLTLYHLLIILVFVGSVYRQRWNVIPADHENLPLVRASAASLICFMISSRSVSLRKLLATAGLTSLLRACFLIEEKAFMSTRVSSCLSVSSMYRKFL